MTENPGKNTQCSAEGKDLYNGFEIYLFRGDH